MEKFPEKSKSDNVHSFANGIISAIPVAGGSLSVLFETVFSTPLDERKKIWFQSLADAIDELTNKVENITPESLSKNKIFISVSMQATQIALRNHQKEKLTALKNAIVNSVIETSTDENKLLMFTRIIDDLTPLHIKVLIFLNNPQIIEQELQSRTSKNIQMHYPNNISIWDEYYSELRSSRDLILQIVKELDAKGFIHPITLLGSGKCTTAFGKEFINFISEANIGK